MEQFALSGQGLEIGKHLVTTVAQLLDLIPLRRIGHRHPQHLLIPCEAVQRQAQIIPANGEHSPRPGAVFLRAGFLWKRRRENRPTGRTA